MGCERVVTENKVEIILDPNLFTFCPIVFRHHGNLIIYVEVLSSRTKYGQILTVMTTEFR